MKIKDLKHNHSLTDLLKVLIFSILMLAPMIAVAVKCAYVVVNKNANYDYSGHKENNISYVNTNIDSLNIGDTYLLQSTTPNQSYSGTGNTQRIYFDVLSVNNYSGNYNLLDAKSCGFYSGSASVMYYYFYDSNNNLIGNNPLTNSTNFSITFRYVSTNMDSNVKNMFNTFNTLFKVIYNEYGYLDNVFYYAIDEVSDNQLFSWTKNTGIYTGIKAMTDNLEITTDIVAVLITYWTLLTIIYVIIDIVLKGFTLLTHMFQKESH